MSFFHRHINWFYAVPLIIGCIFFLIFKSTISVTIAYISFAFFMLGLILLFYASCYKIFKIYKDYIYLPPEIKQEVEYRKRYEIGFLVSYEQEKKFKKSIYTKSLITNIVLVIVSLFVIIYAIVRLFV